MVRNSKDFLLRSGSRHEYLLSPLVFNTIVKVPANAIRQGKEIKYIKT